MNHVGINFELCKECEYCITFCPRKNVLERGTVINNHGYYPPQFHHENCTACGMCAIVCPEAAIEVIKDAN